MRNNIVQTIEDPHEIIEHINNSPRRKRLTQTSFSSMNFTMQALDDVRLQDKFFELVERGGKKDIRRLREELENDPKRHFFDWSDA